MKKTGTLSQQASVADGFSVRGGAWCSFLGLCLVRLTESHCVGLVRAAAVSVNSYVLQPCCDWKTLFSWRHPPLLALSIFLFFHIDLPVLRGVVSLF